MSPKIPSIRRVTPHERAINEANYGDEERTIDEVAQAFACTEQHVRNCIDRVKADRAERLAALVG